MHAFALFAFPSCLNVSIPTLRDCFKTGANDLRSLLRRAPHSHFSLLRLRSLVPSSLSLRWTVSRPLSSDPNDGGDEVSGLDLLLPFGPDAGGDQGDDDAASATTTFR